MPTLETGRRSKHLVLVGEDAIKREKRRQKNREAARKLKEKRQLIEDELSKKVKELESQQSHLQNHIEHLHQQKQHMIYELNNQVLNEIDQLLSDENYSEPNQCEHFSSDTGLLTDAVEDVLNGHLETCFDLSPSN